MNPFLLVIILGIVEGVTEFLPVSSTGHMILVEKFINSPYVTKAFMDNFLIIVQLGAILSVVIYFWNDIQEKFINSPYVTKAFMDNFLIIVQLGAILSVVIYFWNDIHPFVKSKEVFAQRLNLWSKVIVGVIPAGVLGLLLDDYITEFFLGNTTVVAITLILYGIIFCFIEGKIKKANPITKIEDIPYKLALAVGFFQCLAMIPGTSRSGSTIIGALLLGLAKGVAAEFSFFLAIPTMISQ